MALNWTCSRRNRQRDRRAKLRGVIPPHGDATAKCDKAQRDWPTLTGHFSHGSEEGSRHPVPTTGAGWRLTSHVPHHLRSPFPFNPQPGVRITPDVQTRLSWAVGLYSDLHKDVYGVRPRGFLPQPLPEGSDLEELVAEIEGEIEWLTSQDRWFAFEQDLVSP